MWYKANDTTNDWLMHYKYIDKYMKNGRWQYVYSKIGGDKSPSKKLSDTAKDAKISLDYNTMKGRRKFEKATGIGKNKPLEKKVEQGLKDAKTTAVYYANKGKKHVSKLAKNAQKKYKDLTKPINTTKTVKDKNGNAWTETTTGNKIFSTTKRSQTSSVSGVVTNNNSSKKKKRK